jgi:hypothetical protein
MWLIYDMKGISKIVLILFLLCSFIVGALLSYIWTMGYYAPQEFHLPSQSHVTIENVEFNPENVTFVNVTILNPSYSSSNVRIDQILALTKNNNVISPNVTIPSLPFELTGGSSQVFRVYLNLSSHFGQIVNVIALIADGSGATFRIETPSFANLTIASVDFYPEVGVNSFDITVISTQSESPVDVKTIKVNEAEVATVEPNLPYRLDPYTSVTFRLEYNWSDLQGKIVTVELDTLQGYEAYKTMIAPSVTLSITSLVFNATDTSHFKVAIYNEATSQAQVDINQILVEILGENVTITEVSPVLPQPIQLGLDALLTCSWDWSTYQGQNATVAVTVKTIQGFVAHGEAIIP